MRRSRSVAAVSMAVFVVVAGLAAAPAFADDPPPLVWTDAPGFPTVTAEYTTSFLVSETMVDPFGLGYEFAEPLPVWVPQFTNTTDDTTLVVGLGIDIAEEGVIEPMWEEASWGIFDEEATGAALHSGFRIEVPPGESMSQLGQSGLPRWPGHTAAIYLFDETEEPAVITEIARYRSPGRFVPINIDEAQPDVEYLPTVGTELTVAGSAAGAQIFPGLTATASAEGLPAGEVVELWIAPDFDFFFFHLLGAVLPATAQQVGTGLVAANGTLNATFEIPADLELDGQVTPYQLLAGVRGDDFWPAGTWGGFDVRPLTDLESVTDEVVEGEISRIFDVGGGVQLISADGLPAMNVTVTASETGPSISGFTVAGASPVFYHLSSTPPLSGPVQVCVPYEDTDPPGPVPSLFHLEEVSPGNHVWVDITDPVDPGGGIVCGTTTTFSPFVAGYPDAVEFDFDGFFSPVSMDAGNIAKPGQAIPVKFSLGGDQGLDVVTSARFVIEGTDSTPEGELIPTTTAGGSGLSYDASSDTYTYVWKTSKSWSLKTGSFVLELSDGTTHSFDVTFKK